MPSENLNCQECGQYNAMIAEYNGLTCRNCGYKPETELDAEVNTMPDKPLTPYEQHATLSHKLTRHSPDGFVIIEECSDCFSRFLHNPAIGYPVTMSPLQNPVKGAK